MQMLAQRLNYTIEVGNNSNVNIQVNKGNINLVTLRGRHQSKEWKEYTHGCCSGYLHEAAQTLSAEIDGNWVEKVTGQILRQGLR